MTTTIPSVPLPPGACCLDGWQDTDDGTRHYRIIAGQDRWVADRDTVIGSTAIQFSDGQIDDGQIIETPKLWVGSEGIGHRDWHMSTTHARELAAALVQAADEIDGWVQR